MISHLQEQCRKYVHTIIYIYVQCEVTLVTTSTHVYEFAEWSQSLTKARNVESTRYYDSTEIHKVRLQKVQ